MESTYLSRRTALCVDQIIAHASKAINKKVPTGTFFEQFSETRNSNIVA